MIRPTRAHPILAAALVVALALLGACRDPGPATPAPGKAAAPATKPQRIVSLVPNVTEIAWDIGLGDRIVGVSDFDLYPEEAKAKPRVGGLMNPDLERLTALQPDLVFVHSSATAVLEHSTRLGARAEGFNTETLADIEAVYTRVGALAGEQEIAAQRLDALRGALGQSAVKRERGPRVLLVVGRNPGTLESLVGVGRGNFLDELLHRVGGVNALPDTTSLWPQIDKEALLAADPDLIIELSPGGAAEPAEQKALLAPWSALPALKAVREGRVVMLTGEQLLIPGPRVTLTAQALRDAIDRVEAAP